jgi:hypothetical protein
MLDARFITELFNDTSQLLDRLEIVGRSPVMNWKVCGRKGP